MACRGTWHPLVPCPFHHNLPRLPPQNLYRILNATLKEKRSAVFELKINTSGRSTHTHYTHTHTHTAHSTQHTHTTYTHHTAKHMGHGGLRHSCCSDGAAWRCAWAPTRNAQVSARSRACARSSSCLDCMHCMRCMRCTSQIALFCIGCMHCMRCMRHTCSQDRTEGQGCCVDCRPLRLSCALAAVQRSGATRRAWRAAQCDGA